MKRLFETKEDKQNKRPKSFVLLTRPVAHTLGDPSAAAKLIRSMKEQYRDSIKVTMILMVDKKEFANQASRLFQDLDVNFFCVTRNEFRPFIASTDTQALMNSADAIVFFPSFPQFEPLEREEILKRYEKKTCIALEYDAYGTTILDDLGKFVAQSVVLKTGLRPENLGIFCSQETNAPTSNNRAALLEITDSFDHSCRDLLLEREAQIFFGYFNPKGFEDSNPQANPSIFIDCCLELASPDKELIDFVLPLNLRSSDQSARNDESIEYIFSKLQNHPKLKGHQFEFWKKNSEGKMVCLLTVGRGEKAIRFINGFPFSPSSMDKLSNASSEFTLSTGDQKFSEDTSKAKVFLYQTMLWKSDLRENLMILAKKLKNNSKLYEFLTIQKTYTAAQKPIKYFLKTHFYELLAEAKQLRDYILDNKNLYKVLPDRLMNLLNDETYIAACLENLEDSKSFKVFGLLRLYPDKSTLILKILSEQKKPYLLTMVNTFLNNLQAIKDSTKGLNLPDLLNSNWKKYLNIKFLNTYNLNLLDHEGYIAFCKAIVDGDIGNINVLHLAVSNSEVLRKVLDFLPEDQRLAAVLEKSHGFLGTNTLSLAAKNNSESLALLLTLFPRDPEDSKQGLLAAVVQEPDAFNEDILHRTARYNKESLLLFLNVLPVDLLLSVLQKKESGETIFDILSHNSPDVVIKIIQILPSEHVLKVIQEKNDDGQTLLHVMAKDPISLKYLLKYYTSEESLKAAILEPDEKGRNVLLHAASSPESLKLILQRFPSESFQTELSILQEKNKYDHRILEPEVLRQILEDLDNDLESAPSSRPRA